MGTTGGREDRRRRIMERGSDRMALITGRIETLENSSSTHDHRHHSHTQSSPAFFSQHQPPPILDVEDDVSGSGASLKHEIADVFSGGNAFDFGSGVEPQLHKCETNSEAICGASTVELRSNVQSSSATARVPKASDDTEASSKARGNHQNFFTLKEISSSIVTSENTRVFCSITIALLVVLSYINLPRKIVKSKSIVASSPLYVLLLTDFSIVIARLILEKRRGSEKAKEGEELGTQDDGHNWAGAVKFLEIGLVLHQTIRAIFIDCSFYVVIVVCGLSLV